MEPRDFTERFSAALRRSLAANGNRSITAAAFAREFNLRAGALGPISDETARRWLRGDALPELPRLAVLIEWLRIDPVALFSSSSANRPAEPEDAPGERPGTGRVVSDEESTRQLTERLSRMGPRERAALRQLADLLADLDATEQARNGASVRGSDGGR